MAAWIGKILIAIGRAIEAWVDRRDPLGARLDKKFSFTEGALVDTDTFSRMMGLVPRPHYRLDTRGYFWQQYGLGWELGPIGRISYGKVKFLSSAFHRLRDLRG